MLLNLTKDRIIVNVIVIVMLTETCAAQTKQNPKHEKHREVLEVKALLKSF